MRKTVRKNVYRSRTAFELVCRFVRAADDRQNVSRERCGGTRFVSTETTSSSIPDSGRRRVSHAFCPTNPTRFIALVAYMHRSRLFDALTDTAVIREWPLRLNNSLSYGKKIVTGFPLLIAHSLKRWQHGSCCNSHINRSPDSVRFHIFLCEINYEQQQMRENIVFRIFDHNSPGFWSASHTIGHWDD